MSPVAARKAAVLGSPIAHSLSPVLHRAAYRELGLTSWSYEALECDEPALPGLLDSLGPEWAGLSLTMPLKRAVLPLLAAADPLARQVGAANTVVFAADGTRQGYNTDVPGMVTALREAASESLAPNDAVLILGGGATACSALAAVQAMGSAGAVVAVRDESRAHPLLEVAGRLGVRVRLARLGADLASNPWRLLISTVPAGAADGQARQIAAGELVADVVLDVVYQPWPTRLAVAAELAGSTAVPGFELLLHQAAEQVELMTGRHAPIAAMRAAGQAELARRAGGGSAAGLSAAAGALCKSRGVRLRGIPTGAGMSYPYETTRLGGLPPGVQAEDHLGRLPPCRRGYQLPVPAGHSPASQDNKAGWQSVGLRVGGRGRAFAVGGCRWREP